MDILGISCCPRDSAACLIRDGHVIAAAQENRLSRSGSDSSLPLQAINYCLQAGDITTRHLDGVAVSEKPFLKFARLITGHIASWPGTYQSFKTRMPSWLDDKLSIPYKLKHELVFDGPVYFVPHHLSHGASAYLPSPFEESAIITSDSVGEWDTLSIGFGRGKQVKLLKKLRYPHSPGLIYSAITSWLGFQPYRDESRVTALSALGKPAMLNQLKKVVPVDNTGAIALNTDYFAFDGHLCTCTDQFVRLFGAPAKSDEGFQPCHLDMAASIQAYVEYLFVRIACYAHKLTNCTNFCLAGGVHQNCQINSAVIEQSPCNRIFVPPAPGNAGSCIGAALYVASQLDENYERTEADFAFSGPGYSHSEIARALKNGNLMHCTVEMNQSELLDYAARILSEGKVVGWFSGRMEFGSQSLGGRCILADPRNPHMKDHLNQNVKNRPDFQPFGASVLAEKACEYFEPCNNDPYMLTTSRLRKEKLPLLPAIAHADGSCRLQSVTCEAAPEYYELIRAFYNLTGVPLIINTSFNSSGKPLVCSPADAIEEFSNMNIDTLIIPPFRVEKCPMPGKGRVDP